MKARTYEEIVSYIETIPLFGVKTNDRNKSGNENLWAVLHILGHPEHTCPAVHIAGTNGKGSTAVMIADMLTKEGNRVGLFTSPHLVTIRERMAVQAVSETDSICRSLIDEKAFVRAFGIVEKAVFANTDAGGLPLSYFEFLFAMAAVFYAEQKVDYAVYETGLGGRLDATNVLKPKLCVITSIGMDHTKYLGDTIEKIASEKAGIIKPNTPVVFLTGSTEADAVISARADALGAEAINVANSEYIINDFTDKTIDFSVSSRYYRYDNVRLRTCAIYQVDNARLAIAAVNKLLSDDGALAVSAEHICFCMERFLLEGRMEQIRQRVFFDGAHNPAAIERFIETVRRGYGECGIHLLFAVAQDKDYAQMIDKLCHALSVRTVTVTAIENGRRLAAKQAADLFLNALDDAGQGKTDVFYTENIEEAYRHGLQSLRENKDVLFCVGSLYLVGSLKKTDAEVFHDSI